MAQLCAGAMYTDHRSHGGGIGGLAAAVALRRVGIKAAVFEKAPQITEVGAGLSLWSNAMVALRRLGLEAAGLEAGSVIERTRSFLSTGEVGHLVGPDSPQVHKVTMRASAGSRAVTHSGRNLLPHRKPMIRSGCRAGTLRTICYATALCFFKEEFLRYKETSEHNLI